jgi:hypothetical protein
VNATELFKTFKLFRHALTIWPRPVHP